MSNTNTLLQQAGFGYLPGPPLVTTSDALGLTPLKVTLPDFTVVSGGRARLFSIVLTNPNASALIAWQMVPRGSAAPTFAATYVAATPSGAPVLPGTSTSFIIDSAWDLYVVADTASSKFAAVIEMY